MSRGRHCAHVRTPKRITGNDYPACSARLLRPGSEDGASLQRYGIDSVAINKLVADLDEEHDIDVPAALVWTNPTIDALAWEIAALAVRALSRP